MSPPKGKYRMVIPETNDDGDIDEIVEIEIKSVTWDVAEKRVILNW